ncbi:MAG: arginine--tRNA ligase [Gemmataceae bacterium]|nr:arginine--tRNA ligase [Gemmataceae bacterium]MCI0742480.1 arginine--tRNA ligase [Gemmataceae bacterium]
MNLLAQIQERFRTALAGLAPDVEPFVAMVKPAQDAKHGDYQANCAMSLAKSLVKKPREVAEQIKRRLPLGDFLLEPEIAGPGFINLRLQVNWIAQQLREMAKSDRLAVHAQAAKTIVIDFSSPNVAKPLHVGHLRSTIIGDSLTRLLRFLGHKVITDNHLGDWGKQFGILLYGYRRYVDADAFRADPVRELARIYVKVRKEMKDDDDKTPDPVDDAARLETAKLHAGDEENLRLWKMFMPFSLEEIDKIYRRLEVSFDHMHGESFYNDMLPGVVADLLQKGIAQRSDGAVIISLDEDQPPSIIQKRDGAFTYTTSDLATIKYRMETWSPDAILYVVGVPQSLHFKNFFAAARHAGYTLVDLRHISFGSVLGEDRRVLRTRDGGTIDLEKLLDEAVEHARAIVDENSAELPEAERKEIAEAVGIGAVKYADLSQNRNSDYVFNWKKMLAMDGNTATYMQYAYARNRSIFRKGNVAAVPFRTDPPLPVLDSPFERALALQILRLEETLVAAVEDYQPSIITSYLWDVAKSYSGFFQNCPVLKAETPALRDSRLLLSDLTARVIQLCLGLLGIRTVERM